MHTRLHHERLHRHSSFVALFDGSLQIAEYRHLVRRLYGFYAPLDLAIARVTTDGTAATAGFSYAARSSLLALDMKELGFSDREVRDAPLCAGVDRIVTADTLGGVLYVVEGATLGATGIDRAVQSLLRHDLPAGRRFWSWCRAENKTRWTMVNAYLEHLLAEGAAIADLKTGALDLFRELADWLAPLDRSRPDAETGLPWP